MADAKLTGISRKETLQYLGWLGSPIPDELEDEISRCESRILETARPRAVWRLFDLLPDGSLLVLERELSFGGSKPWAAASTARLSFAVYHVEAASGGTRSRASVVKKRKLVSGGGPVFTFGNYEGICLGPRLPGGQSVLLVSDAGDGVSQPLILPMVLSSFNPQKE